VNSLLARVRHTNTLVIADRGFPFWPQLEIIDLSLVDDVPTVLQVLDAITKNFRVGHAWMALEFRDHASTETVRVFESFVPALQYEPHAEFKLRVPSAIGLIRTADTTPYSNIILESA
jgi:D-ribose pyranase